MGKKLPKYNPVQLEQDFINLAFEQSPQFSEGEISQIHQEQNYVFNFDTRSEQFDDRDSMSIKLGLRAVRQVVRAELPKDDIVDYVFSVYCQAERNILDVNRINLAPEEWQRLAEECGIDIEDASDEQIMAATRELIRSEQLDVSQYTNVEYLFTTEDQQLGLDEASGYEIDGEFYGQVDRSDFYGDGDDEPEVLESPLEDDFMDLVSDLEDDIYENGDLVPLDQKQFEARVLIESISKRRLRGV